MANIFPSNTSTNKFASPTNSEQNGLVLTVPANTSATEDWQKNFALVTSLLLCNKTTSNLAVSAKIVNGVTSATVLNGLSLPPNTSYDVINGNKITLKEGDTFYVWHNNTSLNSLDIVLSYTLHRPLTTYDI
jgi:hypothetical protein